MRLYFINAIASVIGMFLAMAATSPAAAAESGILIKNVTVIDGTGRPAQPGKSVLIVGDHIVSIRDRSITPPRGATVINGKGKFLIPGLMDTHIHLEGGRRGAMGPDRALAMDIDTGRRMLHGYLYAGVTAVYDAGNYDKFIFSLREAQRSGQLIAPRIYATGHLITRPGGYAAGGGAAGVDNYEQGVKALDALLAQKPDLVKFTLAKHNVGGSTAELPALEEDVLHRLFMYANERGFRTTIHAVEQTSQRAAVYAGINSLAHPVYMTETDNQLAHLIAAKRIPVSTTLVVLRNIYLVAEDPSFFNEPLFRAMMNESDLAHFRDDERKRYQTMNMASWGHQAFRMASENVRKLYDASATLALGTDRTIGATVHQELELIVGLGIPPLEAIRIGTLNAAVFLDIADKLGSIEEGKLADMVLLNADPSADIRNAKNISMVIQNGNVIDRSKLDLPINQAGTKQ